MPNSNNGGFWSGIKNAVARHPGPVAAVMVLLIVFLVIIFLRPAFYDRTRGMIPRFTRKTPAAPVEDVDEDMDDEMEDEEKKKKPSETMEEFRARKRRSVRRGKRVSFKRG